MVSLSNHAHPSFLHLPRHSRESGNPAALAIPPAPLSLWEGIDRGHSLQVFGGPPKSEQLLCSAYNAAVETQRTADPRSCGSLAG